ncbi:MAG: TIR-like domain-containing protein [Candidatus Pacebacteria bacterium CG10_big_fil_rev_8_21_14_0_10_36_11]|nr:TIR domain-containing protein [Candidatus Pacearchaeota archaeon]OIP74387.1 MAG: TIR-like domain-containing protein [Candidatus Pacebacteria bacterium CG2_30_36_39]PIR64950.1 MAG: TIR-like domain-containing protein [Candidatus Pacebacteria bacterium CG10_big_fil_rev_8_21_14_0_10_36_11]PJC43040.1 MAG: TIR-like domain-containing protein [Candidatus Pacebacteria bacterium CG_4_9_14_0_2_um_filter_36_8]
MTRKTFFSFHYKQDNWRASQVRNSWVTQDRKAAGFFDSAEWEEVKKKDDADIKKWIDGQLSGTSVTVVLIGENTSGRKWIDYEIKSSHGKKNGLLGIYIHNKKDREGNTTSKGRNPFSDWYITRDGKKIYFAELYKTYDWVNDDGYNNMGNWIEIAAANAGR